MRERKPSHPYLRNFLLADSRQLTQLLRSGPSRERGERERAARKARVCTHTVRSVP